jgi:anti-sigma B factor antagonist
MEGEVAQSGVSICTETDMPDFDVQTSNSGPTATVAIDGELDLATVGRLDAALAEVEHDESTTIILDLERVSFIDSTGLRCLLRARRRAEENGRRLELVKVAPEVQRLFDVTGVGGVFEAERAL